MSYCYEIENLSDIQTPSLVYFKDLIERNTDEVIRSVSSVSSLWPHVKTFKMKEVVEILMSKGIRKFKCATLSEALMVASCKPEKILVAYPMIGKEAELYARIASLYSDIEFFTIVDNLESTKYLASLAEKYEIDANVLIDVNPGLDRTGVGFPDVEKLAKEIAKLKSVKFCGLHVYDGNIHMASLDERKKRIKKLDEEICSSIENLEKLGLDNLIVVTGSTGTTPYHSLPSNCFLSPGTPFINDHGYSELYKDIECIPGAVVATRVISHPRKDLFTLDAGYKAIGAEMKENVGKLLNIEAESVMQNEEHWVWRVKEGEVLPPIGSILFVIPTHICSTTNLYSCVYAVSEKKITAIWKVRARNRYVDL